MKQFLIIFVLLLLCYSGNSQTRSELYKTWVPIGSVNNKGEISVTEFQQIITFKKDTIEATFFGIEKDTLLPYSIKGDSMFYSGVDTKLSLVNDSILRITIYGETVVFKALNEGDNRYSAQQLISALKGTEWEFLNINIGERFVSFDSLTREADRLRNGVENVFSFDRLDIDYNYISQDFGFWAVKNVKGQILLNMDLMYGSNDFIILQLKEIKLNEIIFRSWISGKEKEITLRKVPKLSKVETEKFNAKLTGSKWLMTNTQAINNEMYSFSHSTIDYYQSIDTTLLIKEEDMKFNNISYQFSQDSTFSVYIYNRMAYSGAWSILLGGRVIKLEEKWHGEKEWYNQIEIDTRIYERFLKIKSLKTNELHFIREEKIYTGFGSYEGKFIEQKYKKER